MDTLLEVGSDRVLFSVDYPYETRQEADWFSEGGRPKIGRGECPAATAPRLRSRCLICTSDAAGRRALASKLARRMGDEFAAKNKQGCYRENDY
jgi:hypothetical protein